MVAHRLVSVLDGDPIPNYNNDPMVNFPYLSHVYLTRAELCTIVGSKTFRKGGKDAYEICMKSFRLLYLDIVSSSLDLVQHVMSRLTYCQIDSQE